MSAEMVAYVNRLLEGVLSDYGLELVDVEYKREGANWFLRVFIDKPGGVQLEDCSRVSEFLNSELDRSGLFKQRYYLEVSSPGIERPLKKREDFVRFKGSRVMVRTSEKIAGQKHFQGDLVDVVGELLVLETERGRALLPLNLVTQARLKVF